MDEIRRRKGTREGGERGIEKEKKGNERENAKNSDLANEVIPRPAARQVEARAQVRQKGDQAKRLLAGDKTYKASSNFLAGPKQLQE